jgi:hypothetical protein
LCALLPRSLTPRSALGTGSFATRFLGGGGAGQQGTTSLVDSALRRHRHVRFSFQGTRRGIPLRSCDCDTSFLLSPSQRAPCGGLSFRREAHLSDSLRFVNFFLLLRFFFFPPFNRRREEEALRFRGRRLLLRRGRGGQLLFRPSLFFFSPPPERRRKEKLSAFAGGAFYIQATCFVNFFSTKAVTFFSHRTESLDRAFVSAGGAFYFEATQAVNHFFAFVQRRSTAAPLSVSGVDEDASS